MDIGFILLLGVALVAGAHWNRLTKPSGGKPQVHTGAPAAPAGTPTAFSKGVAWCSSNKWLLLIVAGAAIALYMFSRNNLANMSSQTILLWVAGIAMASLFIAGIMGKGGSAGKWTLVLVGIIAGFLLLQQLFFMNSYGDRAPEVRAEFQERNVAEALGTPKVTSEREVQEAPRAATMTERTLDLDEVKWTEVIAYRGQCVWGLTPPGATVHTQARSSEPGAVWVDWVDWKLPKFGALRFRGTEVIIQQKAEEPDGSCKYP